MDNPLVTSLPTVTTNGDGVAPVATTFGGLLGEIAGRQPSMPAVLSETVSVTYGELEQLVDEAAKGLLGLGMRPGDRLCLLVSNRTEWVVATLAGARIGAVVVPLNTLYQPKELAKVLRRTDPRVLIVEESFGRRRYADELEEMLPGLARRGGGEVRHADLPALRALVVIGAPSRGALGWEEVLDAGREVDGARLRAAADQVTADDLLYVLFTSGSTAEPKGVMLRHGSTVANTFAIGQRRAFEPGDRVWFGSPLFYAFGAVNCLPATISNGATLVLQRRFDPDRAVELIERHECNVLYATSNLIRAIYECGSYSRTRTGSLKKGAAGISRAERRLALVEMGIDQATQTFGLTEVYGHCAMGFPDDPLEVKLTTEGSPLPGFEFKIVDPDTNRELRPGETGKLLVRGHTTTAYLVGPAEQVAAVDEKGYFDTGDLGSIGADGYFRFAARLKEVIKTGGVNVSPTEVEQALLQCPGVHQAYVVGIPSTRLGEAVVAILQADDGITEASVREYATGELARFKVPARVLFRSDAELPRLASGKVQKPALRAEAARELGASDR